MKIDPFALELADPLATAAGTIDAREGFTVAYRHRGERGVGEATPLPGWTESIEACREALDRAAAVADEDASERDGSGHGPALLELDAAETPAARHGFATALLDADARADGVSLYQWFDADVGSVSSVPVNATIGDAPVAATVEAAEEAIESGFEALKCKVGARSVAADGRRLRAVREVVSEDVELRVDANAAYDRETAREAVEEFASAGVSYVEQPLAADDVAGHRELRGRGVDIALDESLSEYVPQTILDADAADVLILKPMVVGGPDNAHALAMRARDHGVEPVVTTTVDAVIARTAAVHVAAAIPAVRACGLATADRLAEDLAPDSCPVADGRIAVPQSSGLGVEVDYD
ncbi:mandelate racemase/muconate lactonizing enzyme family protein [Halapricum hydrolyticum]|uniref:o-succinylbenzoate synthase n=1 Tax=Halapricum hydrolyticum TaxID=2979991 RepID=A0AAE3IBW9_9EURY|nr:o-succinylbenzoate synthase [Halapricum hydrolyticum]MCU4717805.1 o-succinylbenzoate synthase [Halapricum hydrolyticum]MCU4726969.1 o-succinylbenzoate synthase [Halapricum hydrolyticum]